VKFSKADQRQQVALVGRQNLFERGALSLVVPELAVRSGEVQPERRRLRVAPAGNREMFDRCARVASFQCVEAEGIPGGRLFAVDCKDGLQMLPSNVQPTGLSGAMGLRKVLLNAGGHGAS
jgi:hypothetical protein